MTLSMANASLGDPQPTNIVALALLPLLRMEREICYEMANLAEEYMIYIYHLIFSCQAAILCLQ